MNYIVLLTCTVCLVTYAVTAVILRKLDQLDISRVRVIPFCGKGGRFKYEILVKTGWGRGSGEGGCLPDGDSCNRGVASSRGLGHHGCAKQRLVHLHLWACSGLVVPVGSR